MVDNYGTRLKYALDARGLSASDLAKRIQRKQKFSKQAISKVVRGDGKCFNAINHAQICLELNIDPYWLALGTRRDGEDNMEPLEATLSPTPNKIPDDILNALREQLLLADNPTTEDKSIKEIVTLLKDCTYETKLEALGAIKHLCLNKRTPDSSNKSAA